MAAKRLGKDTVRMANPPSIVATASIVGPKEGKGPLAQYYDQILGDDLWGEGSWEKAESKLVREVFARLLSKAGIAASDVHYAIAGDLLNQCIASSFGMASSDLPFIGLYGACSTMAESLCIGSMLVDGGFADNTACITSSHFCSAERQFRFPLELGTQRPPTSQWTVTGSGGAIIASSGQGPYITALTVGRIVDLGIKDVNNMGAAMAPAAADTIARHLRDTGFTVDSYDAIYTGDLGKVGSRILIEMLNEEGLDISSRHRDCGLVVFDCEKQDTHSGGSGCGCSAVVFATLIMNKLVAGEYNRVLLVSTGSLHSPTTVQQSATIPGIAHAVLIERNY